jgi:hypothetical protein
MNHWLGASQHFIGRKRLINDLIKCYNFGHKMPFQKTIKLPVLGTIVKIKCHDALASIQRLLTDPWIDPRDYMFWDGDPKLGPPKNLDYIENPNTGKLTFRCRMQS